MIQMAFLSHLRGLDVWIADTYWHCMDNQKDIGLTRRGTTKKPITFRLDGTLVKRLRAVAKTRQVTMTSIIEMSVELGLKTIETNTGS